ALCGRYSASTLPVPYAPGCWRLPPTVAARRWPCGCGGPSSPRSPRPRTMPTRIPPDASVVLTVEDLRGQVRQLLASRLAAEFQKLPTVKAWFASEKYVPRPLPSHAPRLTPHAPRLTPHVLGVHRRCHAPYWVSMT